MSVLDRSELQASPLSDLHTIADQLGIEGFRRMRKPELIDAILAHGAGGPGGGQTEPGAGETETGAGPSEGGEPGEESAPGAGARLRRSPWRARRARHRARDAGEVAGEGEQDGEQSKRKEEEKKKKEEESISARSARSRGRTSAPGEGAAQSEGKGAREAAARQEERTVSGVVELLGNGSAFLRVHPPESSAEDVYISAAQVRRCELVSGDRVSGPLRTPRRSERYPSLVRVETINDAPVGEIVEGARYEDRPVAYPSEPLALGSGENAGAEDSVLQAIARLAPLGRGSRVVIAGPARSGKTTILRRVLGALAGREDLSVTLVLAGVRPEEIAECGGQESAAAVTETETPAAAATRAAAEAGTATIAPAVALSFAASADAQDQAVQRAIEAAQRTAARGGDALVLIDTLDGLHPHAARKVMAAARNLRDGGSLTIIATASHPLGGETTVIALDPAGIATEGRPSLDPRASGTVRPELLVGAEGAAAIARARADALRSRG